MHSSQTCFVLFKQTIAGMNTLPIDLKDALPSQSSLLQPSSNPNHATTNPPVPVPVPALPPALADARSLTFDETLASLNRSPFFMTSLDETDGSGGANDALEALKALAYEGTKVEVAANFREQGNECAREKRWTDAREFYTKALVVLRDGVPQAAETDGGELELDLRGEAGSREVVDEEEEKRKEREIQEAALVNRALCNLEMSTSFQSKTNQFQSRNMAPIVKRTRR